MRWAAIIVLVAVGVLAIARPQSAIGHATLVRSDPSANAFLQTAPSAVSLTFAETLDAPSSNIRVLDAAGRPIATGANELSENRLTLRVTLPALQPGIYNVLWQNVSTVDGHPLRGSFPFTVLNADGSLPNQMNQVGGIGTDPDPSPVAADIAVRALSLFGLILAAGGALLVLLFPGDTPTVRRGLVAMVGVGAAVLVAATLLNLVIIRDTFPDRSLSELLTETRTGSYWLVRLGGTLVIVLAATMFLESRRVAVVGTLAGVAAYLWAYSATSHAAAGSGSGWGQAVDILHGVAAVAWIGAVVGVALTARLLGRGKQYSALMPRFALLASSMVFVLLATGLLNSFIQIDTFDRLWTTRYGLTLAVKLGLMAPLLGLALYNARFGRRRVVAQAKGEPRRFVATVFAEALLGGLVIVAASAMTQTTVSRSIYDNQDTRPFEQQYEVDGLVIELGVDPNRTGLNSYAVSVEEAAGEPVTAERVRLTFRYQDDQTVGPSTLNLARTADGEYAGQGPFLTLEGQWRVEVEVRRPDANDARAFFDVRPAGTAVSTLRLGGAWDNPAPGLSWNEFGGIAALLAALGVALFKGRGNVLRRRPAAWSANLLTLAGFGVGSLLLFGVHGHETDALRRNPIVADQDSIGLGRTLYQQNCIACHGQNGVPPAGLALNPYPLDLTVHVPQHSDGILFNFIANGVPGSAMPAWSEEGLSDTEIWHLVNFLRTLGGVEE